MLALQYVDLLSFLDIFITNRTQLLLMLVTGLCSGQLVVLLLVDTLADLPHFLLQGKQLLVGHVVGVDVDTSLVLHAHHHRA
jgi:hypothetical protein